MPNASFEIPSHKIAALAVLWGVAYLSRFLERVLNPRPALNTSITNLLQSASNWQSAHCHCASRDLRHSHSING